MERRRHRTEARHLAIDYYLEALGRRQGAEALVLSDAQGLVIGGAGSGDREELAALGAASAAATFRHEAGLLHVTRLSAAGVPVVLTCRGGMVAAEACAADLSRLLQ